MRALWRAAQIASWWPALSLAPTLAAQPVRQERRTVAWHAEQLLDLWRQARQVHGADADALDVALSSDQEGNPFLPLARLRARLAGVACDADFVARALVHVNALPEVVDPDVPEDGNADVPFRLHVTLHTPFRPSEERPFTFALDLRDAAGKEVWRGEIGPYGAAALAMFEATTAIPMKDLPNGWYELTARAGLGEDAVPPRVHDPVGRARVLLQRGFVARALALGERATARLASCDDAGVRAAVYGAIAPVHRVYTGEANDGSPDLEGDLRHAVRVLDNLDADRPVLAGATEFFDLAVELAPAPAADRLPIQAHARVRLAAAAGPVPLVLFVVGAPTWDGALARPSAVRTLPPGFLAQALLASGFDAERARVVAVVQSLAELEDPTAALGKVVRTLVALARVDPARVLLVGERDAAQFVLACTRPGVLPDVPRGVVAVAGGGLDRAQVEALGPTRILAVPARGHLSAENLRRTRQFAVDAGHPERVRLLLAERAWPWALPMALPTIAQFAAELEL
ncbi:MAG: hypothetical protein R3F56_02440 [Planctomycetota bacterium]